MKFTVPYKLASAATAAMIAASCAGTPKSDGKSGTYDILGARGFNNELARVLVLDTNQNGQYDSDIEQIVYMYNQKIDSMLNRWADFIAREIRVGIRDATGDMKLREGSVFATGIRGVDLRCSATRSSFAKAVAGNRLTLFFNGNGFAHVK